MGDDCSPINSCPNSPSSILDKMPGSNSSSHRSDSPSAVTTGIDHGTSAVKEEENANRRNSPSGTATNKPSAQLSFSIARLINKMPNEPSASSTVNQPLDSNLPPVYPIPMWPPTSTSSSANQTRMPAFPLPGYCEPASLNQMLRTVLMHHQSGLPTDALATLMRHYQHQFYGHPSPNVAGLFHQPPTSLPPSLNLSATVAAANLQKVEILRSAATASLARPTSLIGPAHRDHPNGKMKKTILELNEIRFDILLLSLLIQ